MIRSGENKKPTLRLREPEVTPVNEALKPTLESIQKVLQELPDADNSPGAVARLLQANSVLRSAKWPPPFDETTHRLRIGDSRALEWVAEASVALVLTSPPYWTLKQYEPNAGQLGQIEGYEAFLSELDKVWEHCARALIPGGRICCVVGDVCIPRKKAGRHLTMPLHADIQVRARKFGLDCLTPIIWQKIANGATEAEGNGAGFYGKPYQPGAIVKNDIEYILFLRKGGKYRKTTPLQRALSMLNKHEMQSWTRSTWCDVRGESTRRGHPAPFPTALADRLIRMFSFAGDTVLDPFVGTGTTAVAALNAGRNSIGVDIEPTYVEMAHNRLLQAAQEQRAVGATRVHITQDGKI